MGHRPCDVATSCRCLPIIEAGLPGAASGSEGRAEIIDGPPEPRFERGYGWVFTKHIQQANEGCDFDFLTTEFGAPVKEPAIY